MELNYNSGISIAHSFRHWTMLADIKTSAWHFLLFQLAKTCYCVVLYLYIHTLKYAQKSSVFYCCPEMQWTLFDGIFNYPAQPLHITRSTDVFFSVLMECDENVLNNFTITCKFDSKREFTYIRFFSPIFIRKLNFPGVWTETKISTK